MNFSQVLHRMKIPFYTPLLFHPPQQLMIPKEIFPSTISRMNTFETSHHLRRRMTNQQHPVNPKNLICPLIVSVKTTFHPRHPRQSRMFYPPLFRRRSRLDRCRSNLRLKQFYSLSVYHRIQLLMTPMMSGRTNPVYSANCFVRELKKSI